METKKFNCSLSQETIQAINLTSTLQTLDLIRDILDNILQKSGSRPHNLPTHAITEIKSKNHYESLELIQAFAEQIMCGLVLQVVMKDTSIEHPQKP